MIIRKNASFFIKDVFYKEKVVPLQLTNNYHQKEMKKLSVIIPIYNTPKPLLEHCIASVQENICNMGGEVERCQEPVPCHPVPCHPPAILES